MPSSRRTSRAAAEARDQILAELKDDHKRVKKAYKEFQKLDGEDDPEACEALVQQVLDELTVHSALEEELLYPAARAAIADENLIDEAEVEHESLHTLIEQLRDMSADDEKYAARFTVLCEYVLHHVKEEEREMFPQLERARLDWEQIATEMTERRDELMGQTEAEGGQQAQGVTAAAGAEGAEGVEGGDSAEDPEALAVEAATMGQSDDDDGARSSRSGRGGRGRQQPG